MAANNVSGASPAEAQIINRADVSEPQARALQGMLGRAIDDHELNRAMSELQRDANHVQGGSFAGTVDALQLSRDLRAALASNDRLRSRQVIGDAARRTSTINVALATFDGREMSQLVDHVRGTPQLTQLATQLAAQPRPAAIFPATVHELRRAITDPSVLAAFNRLYIPV